ncbi:MAG TPA: decarboxylating 6-phosphogluconate dehydrogenase [Candidatus Kapabacteria bacterium]|jgi:6-phosphogluconate dehydrogenase|nr:decarboxylating 6-phosphogluconate dehydrogenase [Candidatus Kapabacteria bacterium]
MEMGMIGLGRMGANMAARLVRGGHKAFGYDPNADARKRVEADGISAYDSLTSLVAAMKKPPRAIWMMVPAGAPVDETIASLTKYLERGDILIDGGNSNYKDTIRRAESLQQNGIAYVDAGTSGGIWGLKEGYSLMIGGDEKIVEQLRPIFETLAPTPTTGWGRVGPSGSGHLVKMVHNGIEYGMMQAYAEGLSILKHKKDFGLDAHQIAEIWRYGSVIRSWLLDLTADALGKNPELEGIAPVVADSGEGRWTVFEAIDNDVPAPIITLSLIERLRSRDKESFSDKLLSAMRNEFGGHPIVKE